LEQIIPTLNEDPLEDDQVTQDGGDMDMEIEEKELAKIDMVHLEEDYRKKEL
jgi:hypothetical protein